MSKQIEAIEKGMCMWCDVDVNGQLSKLDNEKFRSTGLCPECYIYSIRSDKSKLTKAPVQMGLPMVGTMPAIIQMSPVSFGTMCTQNSTLLRDCIIRAVYQGPICTFDIICNDETGRNNIRDYLLGEV